MPNPFNPNMIQRISLAPEDVDAIWFWTRNPRPMFSYLDTLDRKIRRYFFLVTLMNNPADIDPDKPSMDEKIRAFQELGDRIGPERVAWRYDPIVLSNMTPPEFHVNAYHEIASSLQGYTRRSIISFVDIYRKLRRRIDALAQKGVALYSESEQKKVSEKLLSRFSTIAGQNGMTVQTCAEDPDYGLYGIPPGKCIDHRLVSEVFNLDLNLKKDPSQRKTCGCSASKDIGVYDTCIYGCSYCYAVSSFQRSRENYRNHDPFGPCIVS